MGTQSTFLVFGATGRTGRYFLTLALQQGHRVRAVTRNPHVLNIDNPNLEVRHGSIADYGSLDDLLRDVECVAAMLGDAQAQRHASVNARFVQQLIPAMRRQGVRRLLYQAGGLTRPYKGKLSPGRWLIRNTLARFNGLIGQHKDNEAVIAYLVEQAEDIAWVVHRAGIVSDGRSKGLLRRSTTRSSLATFTDCATYNYQLLFDDSAVHTYDLSRYG